MRRALGVVLIGVAVVVLIILSSATFVVLQTEQALVLRFGEPVAGRGLITDPGLHFKIPFVETVVLLDNRILDLESPKQEVLASDNQRIGSMLSCATASSIRYASTRPSARSSAPTISSHRCSIPPCAAFSAMPVR